MKLKKLAWLVALAALSILNFKSTAATVAFNFTAEIVMAGGPGVTNLPPGITNGAVVFGMLRYPASPANVDFEPDAHFGSYNFPAGQALLALSVGTNTFSSSMAENTYLTVINDGGGSPPSDEFSFSSGNASLNRQPLPGTTGSGYISLGLGTTNLGVLSSDAPPALAPSLADFPGTAYGGYRSVSFYTYEGGVYFYGFSAEITSISPIPELHLSRSAANSVLTWHTNAPGFQVQVCTNLANTANVNGWLFSALVPTIEGTNYTLTLPGPRPLEFYRLAKPFQAD